jgi:hypothetical protein
MNKIVTISNVLIVICYILLLTIMNSCSCSNKSSVWSGDVENSELVSTPKFPKIEKLMYEVDHGLNKVQLDDSTTILIYRGVESCTMIQIK